MRNMQTEHERRKKVGNRIILLVIFIAVVLGYIGFVLASHGGPKMLVQSNGNEIGGSFRLNSLGESTVTEGDFHGTWMLVWFFDPRCPKDQCQPVLKSMETAKEALHAKGIRVSALAVSLDMDAVDNDVLKDYVIPIAPHVMPFTASPNMLKAMTTEYHAPFEKVDGHYLQAPQIVVMNPDSRYAGMIAADGDADALTAQIQKFAAR